MKRAAKYLYVKMFAVFKTYIFPINVMVCIFSIGAQQLGTSKQNKKNAVYQANIYIYVHNELNVINLQNNHRQVILLLFHNHLPQSCRISQHLLIIKNRRSTPSGELRTSIFDICDINLYIMQKNCFSIFNRRDHSKNNF